MKQLAEIKQKLAGVVPLKLPSGEAKFGLAGPPVKGAPYAADAIVETTQTLADGTRIHRQDKFSIARDGEGRMRRESTDEVLDLRHRGEYDLHPEPAGPHRS